MITMYHIRELVSIAKELAKVVMFTGLCILVFYLVDMVSIARSERDNIHTIILHTRGAMENLELTTNRVHALIGSTETRDNAFQTVAHAVNSVNQAVETTTTTVKGIQPLVADSGAIMVNIREATRQISDITVPRVNDTVRAIPGVVGHIDDVVRSAQPLVAHTDGLITDVKDSLDDSYWDIKAMVESATVATTQVAQSTQTFNAQLPALVATLQGTNVEINRATTVLADAIVRYFKPSPFRDRLLKLLPVAGELVIIGKASAK